MAWLLANATAIAAFGGLAFGLIGTALSVWSRIDSFLATKKKQAEELPRAKLIINSQRPNGVHAARLIFENTYRFPLHVTAIEIQAPAGMLFAVSSGTAPNVYKDQHVVDWIIGPLQSDNPGTARGNLHFKYAPTIVPAPPNISLTFQMKLSGTIMNERRKKVTILAVAIIKPRN